jgi:D-tyrosyl-tRNA(Tyr) deacylase
VEIDGKTVGSIAGGLLILLGIEREDADQDAEWLVNKIVDLRIFDDESGKMNLSARDIGGELLIVSQFTLYGDCRKGRRPSFDRAARPEAAVRLYEYFVAQARATGLRVETGVFQASMQVHLVNEGPVTLICESK